MNLAISRLDNKENKDYTLAIGIPDSVKQLATNCQYDFDDGRTASNCGNRPLCEVGYSAGKRTLVLTADSQSTCPYNIDYGLNRICTCPVREYLHDIQYLRIG